MLQQLGIKVQKFELNKILGNHDRNKDGQLTKEEFESVRKQNTKGNFDFLNNMISFRFI